MKKLSLSLSFLFTLLICTYSQSPESFKYQTIIRDSYKNPISNKEISLRFSIYQESISGFLVYQETFAPVTNAFGLVNLDIGTGAVQSGNFSEIDWVNGPYFIETAIDTSGGYAYTIMGSSQLLSVPYALHAKTVEFDQVDDADADSTNEIQNLHLVGNILSIDRGNSVTLENSSSYWMKNNNDLYYNDGLVGIGTIFPDKRLTIQGTTSDTEERCFLALRNKSYDSHSSVNLKLYAGNDNSFTGLYHHAYSYTAVPDYDETGGIWNNGKGLVFTSTGGGNIRFQTSTEQIFIERMRLNEVGNLGLGTTSPKTKLHIADGDIYLEDINSGVIMKSPNGQCWKMTVDNNGSPVFTAITCP